MIAILTALARPLIEAALLAFGRTLTDMLRAWRANEDAKALGRAEAVNAAHENALQVERDMNAVGLPEHDELLERLRSGTA